ncbi:hypothetical protein HOLleu_05515 [Holothuria leucospilota]|uniref:LRAT domain-containing protein n=1 Tax=Holothuria leucospilota TaxID=206669 RepID=A0A9Q1HJ30_HOLLE|nr:hypothetical protein HOLleu_05515 [Holothuria leucospilota]
MGLTSCKCRRSSDVSHRLLGNPSSQSNLDFAGNPTLLFSYPDNTEGRSSIMAAWHDKSSPNPGCCKKSGIFRVYCGDKNGVVPPSGLYCENCHVEYLDREKYPGLVYDEHSQVNIICYKTNETIDQPVGNWTPVEPWNYFHEPQTITMHKRLSSFRFVASNALLSMVNPNRRYLDHRNVRDVGALQAGDHIMWHRPYALWHHQLIKENKGNGKCDVIHFDSGRTRWVKAEVQFIKDFDFTIQRNGTAYKIIYDSSVERENPIKLVFDRASSKLKDTDYTLLKNNCEHLVTFCKTGKPRSLQVYWLFSKFIFLLLRVTILSLFIYISIQTDLVDHSISHGEEIGELFIVLITELVLWSTILGWHVKLYYNKKIGALDFGRRIGEANLESIITVVAYILHVFLIFKAGKQMHPSLHILLAIVFGFFGRVIGCFASQACLQKILKPLRMNNNQPRCTYGASDFVVFGGPTCPEEVGV